MNSVRKDKKIWGNVAKKVEGRLITGIRKKDATEVIVQAGLLEAHRNCMVVSDESTVGLDDSDSDNVIAPPPPSTSVDADLTKPPLSKELQQWLRGRYPQYIESPAPARSQSARVENFIRATREKQAGMFPLTKGIDERVGERS